MELKVCNEFSDLSRIINFVQVLQTNLILSTYHILSLNYFAYFHTLFIPIDEDNGAIIQ